MTDIDSTSSYGGARVDEMLPPAHVAKLMAKLTPPKGSGRSRQRAGLTSGKAQGGAKKRKSA